MVTFISMFLRFLRTGHRFGTIGDNVNICKFNWMLLQPQLLDPETLMDSWLQTALFQQ